VSPSASSLVIDGVHVFLREPRNGKIRLWYLNLRGAQFEYIDCPDDEFTVGHALRRLQHTAEKAGKSGLKQWAGDKIIYASPLPELLKTLYNGEYGRECRRKRAA